MTSRDGSAAEETCDLCILGGGYAAINAFNAATKHLSEGARVVVIARERAWGGNWVDQYDFVRLHQGYAAFTAGERTWNLQVPPEHLARKKEILQHFENIVEACVREKRLRLVCLFEYEYSKHSVREGKVEISTVPIKRDTLALPPVRVIAGKFIKAHGASIKPKLAFGFPAELDVHSLCPCDIPMPVWSNQMRYSKDKDKPIYIVGSGKTAMDVINYLCHHLEGAVHRIRCISGRGTWFLVRDELNAAGVDPESPGATSVAEVLSRIIEPFDGANGLEAMRQLDAQGHVHSAIPDPGAFFLGICSRAEIAVAGAALSPTEDKIIKAHLVDMVGAGGEPTLVLQALDGKTRFTRRIERGAFIVNCTDHVSMVGHEPVLSGDGLVLSPQWLCGFTGPSANICTHHFYAGTLEPLWRQLPRPSLNVVDKCSSGLELALCVTLSVNMAVQALPKDLRGKYFTPQEPIPVHSAKRVQAMMPRLMRTHASRKTRYTDEMQEASEPLPILGGNLPALRSRL